MYKGLVVDSNSVLLMYTPVLATRPHGLGQYGFIVGFEIREYKSLPLCSLFLKLLYLF